MQDLLDLALEDPDEGDRRARRILAEPHDALAASYAHQCLGIVLRDKGQVADALGHLRHAVRSARSCGGGDRERDVRATLGATLVFAGRTRAGLAELDDALSGASGSVGARILMRKAATLAVIGRHDDAIPLIRTALQSLQDETDEIWEGRARVWLGHLLMAVGSVDDAEVEVIAAERLFARSEANLERLTAVESRAEIAAARGDLATSLGFWADAASGYSHVREQPRFAHIQSHSATLLSAGLSADAVDLLERAGAETRLAPHEVPELQLRRAAAFLAVGLTERAHDEAVRAGAGFRQQGRSWFELRARLVAVRANELVGARGGLSEARKVAEALHAESAREAPLALTIAGKKSTGAERSALWQRAASYRVHPNGLVRASAHLAEVLEREERADRRGVLRACSSGLDAIDEHRRLMGSSELRALATTHGRELTEVALRHAAHDPRTLLRWSERTRATALAQPPATSDATTIPAPLAALRDNGRRLAGARQAGEPTEDLEKERLRLERAVRTEHHTQSAAGADPRRPASVDEIVAGVGDGCLVELVDVDGTLHVLVVHRGRVRRKVAGTTAAVADLLGPARMLLRRAARGRPANTADIGRRLQEAILGDAAGLLPDGPVTLAPTARLHGLAWSLLPALHDLPFGIVPSAGQWLRAAKAMRPDPRRTVLVIGPDLESGGAEVPVLAGRHQDAVLLDGQDATLAAVLDALDGADLAHLATHGRFRADSPLFSALDLADGPLTVHDLERLRTAPYRVVLSACESGVLAPVGAQELLGLAAALFSIGTAGLVSSVGEVNDAATADLMVGLHDGLAAGKDPAAALLDVRRAVADDPVAAGTAAAFVALGV